MKMRFSVGMVGLLLVGAPGSGNAQDLGTAIKEFPPIAFLRGLTDQLTAPAPQPAAPGAQADVEYVEAGPGDRGPARADEVLSPSAKRVLAKRDAFGAPETPIICTNCSN